MPLHTAAPVVSQNDKVYGTEDILLALCGSVSRVLEMASRSPIRYASMVQRIQKTCLKPDIGCFILFDGGLSGLVIINFSAAEAMELYDHYMLSMGMDKKSLASSYTSDEVSNAMGELMTQIVGDFTSRASRVFQTHITRNQPKMLVLNQPVILRVDSNRDRPEARRVTFFTGANNIFYLELAIDHTEFICFFDDEMTEETSPDDLFAQAKRQVVASPEDKDAANHSPL
jgi:chemotaxis protein CheY-P-specific phosphatase CheC